MYKKADILGEKGVKGGRNGVKKRDFKGKMLRTKQGKMSCKNAKFFGENR